MPKNEYELVELKTYIDNYNNKLTEINRKINAVNGFLELLENYCYEYDVIIFIVNDF